MNKQYEIAMVLIPLIISILGFPLLTYLTYKFYKLKQHFLIKARFPKVTIIIFISMYIAVTEHAIAHYILYMYDNDKQKANQSNLLYPILISTAEICVFLFCAFIVYRSLLMYDRGNILQYALKNQSKIICGHQQLLPDLTKVQKQQEPTKHIYNCFCMPKITFFHPKLMWSVTLIFIISFIIAAIASPAYAIESPTLQMLTPLPYIIIIFIGCIVVFKARNIKESILFKRETYIIMLLIFLQLLTALLRGLLDYYLSLFISFMIGTIGWSVTLIVSLSMVYKNEGSLKHKISTGRPSFSIELSASLSVQRSVSETPNANQKINKMQLNEYLKSLDNYNRFGEFLSECFAFENLLFFVKAVVFRHVVLHIVSARATQRNLEINENKSTVNNEHIKLETDVKLDKWCPTNMQKQFGLKFEYINELYKSLKPDKINKDTIYDVAKGIYDTFISTDAVYEVNISGHNKDILKTVFEHNNAGNNRTIELEEYLVVFNPAIIEVYALLKSVYKFKYKKLQTV